MNFNIFKNKKIMDIKKLIIVLLGFVLYSCMSEEEYKEYKENKKRIYEIERVISEKDAPIENEFSGVDFIFGEGSITKSVTVYYFYSEDGLSVKVDRKTYFSKKVGDVYVGEWN